VRPANWRPRMRHARGALGRVRRPGTAGRAQGRGCRSGWRGAGRHGPQKYRTL
jgi:hypothetical protein